MPFEELKRLPEWVANAEAVYLDTRNNAILYVKRHPSEEGKMMKAVVKPEQRLSKKVKELKNLTVTLGVVKVSDLSGQNYKKIK